MKTFSKRDQLDIANHKLFYINFQDSKSFKKLTETELNTLYRLSIYNSNKTRQVILKLRSQSVSKRLLSLRNLKPFHHGREINIYINVYRTKSEMDNF